MARGFSLVVGSILVSVLDDFRTYHTEWKKKSVQSWHRRFVFFDHLITLFAREINSGESVSPICFLGSENLTLGQVGLSS
jgi:hypothetical protein